MKYKGILVLEVRNWIAELYLRSGDGSVRVTVEMCLSKLSVESIVVVKYLTHLEYVISWLSMMIGGEYGGC